MISLVFSYTTQDNNNYLLNLDIILSFKPFEIITFKIKNKKSKSAASHKKITRFFTVLKYNLKGTSTKDGTINIT